LSSLQTGYNFKFNTNKRIKKETLKAAQFM